MTFGSPAVRPRDDGTEEYTPAVPVRLLEAAFRAEIALQSGSQARVVDRESNLVGRHSPCPKKSMERPSMWSTKDDKTFKQRLASALEQRLYPHSNLHPKQLCYALGVTRNTLDNWLSANNEPKGGHVMALIRFFDSGFAQEISQGHVTKITDRRAMVAIQKMAEAQRELNAALNGEP